MNLFDKVNDIKDLGNTMSANCNFDQHINNVFKQCSRLSGWILRTFISRVYFWTYVFLVIFNVKLLFAISFFIYNYAYEASSFTYFFTIQKFHQLYIAIMHIIFVVE